MSITYDKFFRITNCDAIIFFEDDLSGMMILHLKIAKKVFSMD